MIIILSIPYAEGEMYSLFTVNSRFSGFLLEKMSPVGMEMCVKECAKRVSCASLNFHRGRLECELSHSDATANPEGMTSNSEYIYIDRSHIPQVYREKKEHYRIWFFSLQLLLYVYYSQICMLNVLSRWVQHVKIQYRIHKKGLLMKLINWLFQKYFDACSASCPNSRYCVSTATGPKCVKSG